MADGDWFAPKQYGFGSGPPVSWQGWVVTIGFIVSVTVAALTLMPSHKLIFYAMLAVLSLGFCVICAQHTPGGWQWRWGKDD
jgi:hypothetical protein